jgi:hypothetical protein
VLRAVVYLVSDENLDLYVLAIAALAFTLLGLIGTVSLTILASGILGLLALLAISQVRSRRQVSVIASAQRADPLALFMTAFPGELTARRSAAGSFLFIGESMIRLVHDGRTDIKRILLDGGQVRVMLLDPDDHALMRTADRTGEQVLENRIRSALAELGSLRDITHGQMEIRVCAFVPRFAVTALDLGAPGGSLFVQLYQHRPQGDSAPVFQLTSGDGFWYEYFASGLTRMWDDGKPWPAATATTHAPAAP